jgi:hypothetical protein
MNPEDKKYIQYEQLKKLSDEFKNMSKKLMNPITTSVQKPSGQAPVPPTTPNKNNLNYRPIPIKFTDFKYGYSKEEMPAPKKESYEVKYLIGVGTVIFAYNSEDGQKYKQELKEDFYFTPTDIITEIEETGDKRISLNKGIWAWLEVNSYDIQTVHIFPKKVKHVVDSAETQLIKKRHEKEWTDEGNWITSNSVYDAELERMSKEIKVEIDKQVIQDLTDLYKTNIINNPNNTNAYQEAWDEIKKSKYLKK